MLHTLHFCTPPTIQLAVSHRLCQKRGVSLAQESCREEWRVCQVGTFFWRRGRPNEFFLPYFERSKGAFHTPLYS